ncbi:MAG: hypothetical protein H6876_06195 [Hyphomicrobiaceae bacterium]|nr:hypothetical protein [Hyphomicrobiaceae bacterium]
MGEPKTFAEPSINRYIREKKGLSDRAYFFFQMPPDNSETMLKNLDTLSFIDRD